NRHLSSSTSTGKDASTSSLLFSSSVSVSGRLPRRISSSSSNSRSSKSGNLYTQFAPVERVATPTVASAVTPIDSNTTRYSNCNARRTSSTRPGTAVTTSTSTSIASNSPVATLSDAAEATILLQRLMRG